ncbi:MULTISPECIES: gluconokinase [unclassified Microbacterium]|uniref:gluconokinase n=1 Tax=unclassified Microbacterium TaxID=2609290 RepID=UPI00214C01EC|nr:MULTISPECIES: gluconokinase [unclassified Microbacterium]MCR2784317.1 gluconokinase [Microbacterium sp. zg.B96]MDL5350775.1 gluconokinase [Microbacterium sp. zg-YB36]WIM14856.1 gluconokinase [Microbacterium sp. zg-B96]
MTEPAVPLPPLVVMGVSGSGKSTIGSLLGQRTGVPFIDGDALHPASNVAKMAAGEPLDDDDRWPWLQAIGHAIADGVEVGSPTIVACSALKRRYRDALRAAVPELRFALLTSSRDVLDGRVRGRGDHFMPATLLDSQLDALEPLEPDEAGVIVDNTGDPEEVVARIVRAFAR